MSNDDDMGEFWRDVKSARQQKRADNRNNSAQILTDKGIQFESKNDGAHLLVATKKGRVDFWPGTGRWNGPKGARGFGVFNLIKFINEEMT